MNSIDINKIKELIESDISSYKIEKITGVSRVTLAKYRSGSADIMNMSLEKALELNKFWEEYQMTTKKEKIEDYLENYSETMSTSMDEMFDLFKTDVRELSQEYKKGEAYVYTVKELREECEENDDQERLLQLKGHKDDEILIDTINGYMYFCKG